MTDPVLKFLSNEAGEKEGLGDAGIETFRDTPYASCAREAGQNSRDAAKELPVRMTFDIRRLGHQEFPSHSELSEAIDACKAEASQDRETAFFTNAADIINGPQIPVLEISDSNTTGLTGPPNDHGTPFHSLVKASGVTVKSDAAAGGSFGIGKNASFAVSDLQTVFYSSVYEDPETGDEAFAALDGRFGKFAALVWLRHDIGICTSTMALPLPALCANVALQHAVDPRLVAFS